MSELVMFHWLIPCRVRFNMMFPTLVYSVTGCQGAPLFRKGAKQKNHETSQRWYQQMKSFKPCSCEGH